MPNLTAILVGEYALESVRVYYRTGRLLIMETSINKTHMCIDVNRLGAEIYILQITDIQKNTVFKKFIKK